MGRYSVRALAAQALTVEWAARIHRVRLEEFLEILRRRSWFYIADELGGVLQVRVGKPTGEAGVDASQAGAPGSE